MRAKANEDLNLPCCSRGKHRMSRAIGLTLLVLLSQRTSDKISNSASMSTIHEVPSSRTANIVS